MKTQHKINQIKAWWHKKHLALTHNHAKATLQHDIEAELVRLKQEDTPLSKGMPQQENRPMGYLAKPLLSDIFQQ